MLVMCNEYLSLSLSGNCCYMWEGGGVATGGAVFDNCADDLLRSSFLDTSVLSAETGPLDR